MEDIPDSSQILLNWHYKALVMGNISLWDLIFFSLGIIRFFTVFLGSLFQPLECFFSYPLFFIATSETYQTQNYVTHNTNKSSLFVNLHQKKNPISSKFHFSRSSRVLLKSKFIEWNEEILSQCIFGRCFVKIWLLEVGEMF